MSAGDMPFIILVVAAIGLWYPRAQAMQRYRHLQLLFIQSALSATSCGAARQLLVTNLAGYAGNPPGLLLRRGLFLVDGIVDGVVAGRLGNLESAAAGFLELAASGAETLAALDEIGSDQSPAAEAQP
jgi:hypothetical protein